jgi:hypothetical protein
MAKFIVSESSLYNGISQQNPALRLDSQVEDAYNSKLSVAHGLEKRASASLLTEDTGSFGINTKVHPIDIDERNRYLLVFNDGTTAKDNLAYGIDGLVYPVVTEDASVDTYLTTPDSVTLYKPDEALRLTTVLSTTIITNKNVTTALTGSPTASLSTTKYLWFKNGVQQVDRAVTVAGSTWNDAKRTDNDTRVLADSFNTFVNGLAGYTGTKISDSVVKVVKDDGGAFTMSATDSYSDTTMTIAPVAGTVREDLPPRASDDEIIKIIADADEEVLYYLKYDSETQSWFETVGENTLIELDANTMPHQIKLLVDTDGSVTGTVNQLYFYISRIDWGDRVTGDSDTNPSFIGDTVNDVFYFKNRLGFLTTESVVCSAIDDIYNFFAVTAKEVLDDDPIDLSVSTTKSVILEFASPFPDSIAVMGNNQQYSLHSDGKPFTSTNATIDPTTAYDISSVAKPQSVGSSIYMVVPMDSYSAVREYAVTPDSLVTDASDITGHVPRLIPSSIKQIIPESNLDYAFLVDKEEADSDTCKYILWSYKFAWQGKDKVQSSWTKWDFWFRPLGGFTFGGKLYLIGTETINNVDSTVVVQIGLETKSVIIPGYINTEPLIDRLLLSEDSDVYKDEDQAIVEVTQELWDTLEGIDCAEFVLTDRVSGLQGDYIDRFVQGGKYYARFDLKVIHKEGVWYLFDDLIGQYKIGGVD